MWNDRLGRRRGRGGRGVGSKRTEARHRRLLQQFDRRQLRQCPDDADTVTPAAASRRRVSAISTARAVSMRQEIRVNFTGQTTLDNGITVTRAGRAQRRERRQIRQRRAVRPRLCRFQRQVRLDPHRRGEQRPGHRLRHAIPAMSPTNFGVNSPNESYSDVGFAQNRNKTLRTADVSNSRLGYFSTFGVAPMGSIGTCFGIAGQGQQDPVFLAGLRRLHLRRLLHADGQPAARRRRPLLWHRRHGAGAGQ